MAICEKILIAGFSGSGKTSLLQILERSAPSEEWIFHDLDQVILKKHKFAHIETLVETHGWEKFRLWERQALEGWVKVCWPSVEGHSAR
jgi:shikimate kinase